MPTAEEKAANMVKRVAERSARTHRGESALEFHLAHWREECSEYNLVENYVMAKAAKMLIREGLV